MPLRLPAAPQRAPTGGVIVPISAGEQVAGPYVHHEHTDAFYVLEGRLTFEIGHEAETITAFHTHAVASPSGRLR